jgi:hypothetical protein
MDPREAVLHVLRASDEPLHWTRVLDLTLRGGYLDPFERPHVRRDVQTALRALARDGTIAKVDKGVYRATPQLEADDD